MPHDKRKHEDSQAESRHGKKSKHYEEKHGHKRKEKDKHHRHHKKQKVEQPTKTLSTGKELRIKKFDLKTINTNRDGKRILIVGRFICYKLVLTSTDLGLIHNRCCTDT